MGAGASAVLAESNLHQLGKLYVQNRGKASDEMMLMILESKMSQLPTELFDVSAADVLEGTKELAPLSAAVSPSAERPGSDRVIEGSWGAVSKPLLAKLQTIKRADLQEICGFAAPPPLCQSAVEACLITLGDRIPKAGSERAWIACKRGLGDHRVLIERFQDFSPSSINPQVVLRLRRYTSNPIFTVEQTARVSHLCSQLVEWVLAIEQFGNDGLIDR
jgi:hypothetical protein